jgi:nucleotide-binding universal stress UspA family protein
MPDAKGAIGPGAKAIAAARAQAEAVHVNFEAHVMTGHPVPAICDLKCADRFDLLVIGDLGRSEFYKWLFGSTTDRLVSRAPCKVLVVKRPQQ